MDTTEWLKRITDDAPPVIASTAKISDRTLRHQISRGALSLENMVKIANAYGMHPIRVLIDMDLADESWSSVEDIEGALRRATDEQLTDEFLRRLKASPNPEWDEPVGDLEAKRRSRHSPRGFDDEQGESGETTPSVREDWDGEMPADAVADSSPEEGGTPDRFEP